MSRSDIVGSQGGVRARMGRPLAYVFLAFLIAATILPFLWVMFSAFSTNDALFAGEFEYTWWNFKRVLGFASEEEILFASGRTNTAELNFLRALRNSVVMATTIAIGQVFFSAMAAYAFARLEWKGRDKIFLVYLTGMMIPPIITLIPNAIFVRELGWSASMKAIVAPFFLMSPFAVFFMRQFFLSVNRSIEEAAMIDGAGPFRIFASINLPMVRPQMVTLAVLTYVTAWNEFLWPFTVAPKAEEVQPLTVALREFNVQTPGSRPDWSGLLAATTIATLPVILIFLVFGRRIVDSIRFTGVK